MIGEMQNEDYLKKNVDLYLKMKEQIGLVNDIAGPFILVTMLDSLMKLASLTGPGGNFKDISNIMFIPIYVGAWVAFVVAAEAHSKVIFS